ncbi:MAG: hypothetical protein FIA82_02590 [Melioribacter sp.]|nr:hypothetical protein [Melioribacter sp.]
MKWAGKLFICFVLLSFSFLSNIFAQTGSVLTFSEIMFSPSETNGEFVEIYNTSATETVDLTNYKFKYYTSSNNNIIALSGGMLLGPGKFAVIFQGNYDYANGIYKTLIPADALVLKISTNNFGSSGMANTTSRDVFLINASGQTIESYTYSANNSAGISDEKYILSKDNTAANWKNSLAVNGTPGKKNSVSPLNNDLNVTFPIYSPASPKAEDTLKVTVKIKNNGKLTATNFSVNIFSDVNNDSLGQVEESIFDNNYINLASGDSIMIQRAINAPSAADYHFIASVEYAADENISDNKAFLKITVAEKPAAINEIVVNEFMYSPSNDEPEWIELYNRSNRAINLKNWKMTDNSTTATISTTDYFLNPLEFLVVAGDSVISNYYQITSKLLIKQLPSLNNSGDNIILKSNFNTTIDSVKYFSVWGGTGNKSLERISVNNQSNDADNWSTSRSKFRATPGKINSITVKANDLSIKNITSDVKYVETGGSVRLNIVIENLGMSVSQSYMLKIYNDLNLDNIEDQGELIGEILGTNIALNSSQDFDYTVTNLSGGINQIIAKINFANDEFTENNISFFRINAVTINELKGDLIINEIMYGPTSPEQEWIEIYNKSSKQINLKGYKISNLKDTTKVINTTVILQPEDYFVVAKDTIGFSKYPNIPKYYIASFPTLSNSGDKVIFLDSLNRAIDSLAYKSSWGGTGGKSLERIEAASSSNDSANWKSSGNINNATPGFVNSVSKKDYDVGLPLFSVSPQKPMVGERVKINVNLWNPGKKEAAFVVKLFEILYNGEKILLKNKNISLHPIDDVGFYFGETEYVIDNLDRKRTFEYFADFPLDQDTTNNRKIITVRPGYPPEAVVLNEIMYNPSNGEPEWIELFNNSQFDIDLEEWSITDVLTTPQKTKIQAEDYIFPNKTFLVIAKDSTIKNFHSSISSKLIISPFANLNNDADGLVLKDSRDVTIDSVRYDSFWGGANGKSLERKSIGSYSIDRNNWSSSKDVELSTPGRVNSVTQKKFDLTVNSITTTPQYPAYNEEVFLNAKVVNYGSELASSFIVKFYLRTNNVNSYLCEVQETNLNGKDSVLVTSSSKLKLNESKTILCKVIFIGDEDTMNNSFISEVSPGDKRNSVQISEVMYDPLTNESEWVEIYNSSSDLINLKNWSISDQLPLPTKSVIASKDNFLNPGEYAVIAYDTLKYPYYPPRKFLQAKFGSLSSSDGVVIYDFRNAVIDSLKYNSDWGGAKGSSMERLSFLSATNDSSNWATTLDPNGATAGLKNSIVDLTKYTAGVLVINEIMFDPATGSAEYIEFYNTTNDSIQLGGSEIKIGSSAKYKLAKTFYKLPPRSYFVLASDSSIYRSYPVLKLENKTKIAESSSFSLPNESSQLILKDFFGDTLDSLVYSSSWHNKNILTTKGRSLERLNPLLGSNNRSNWNTSVVNEGGSPGEQNSIYSENNFRESKVVISPNPFSPDNDGFEDYAIINFDLNRPLSQVRIKVFDSLGRSVRNIAENRLASSKNSVIFDGLDDNGRPLRIGIYILLIEAVAEGSGNVDVIKAPVVIARKL